MTTINKSFTDNDLVKLLKEQMYTKTDIFDDTCRMKIRSVDGFNKEVVVNVIIPTEVGNAFNVLYEKAPEKLKRSLLDFATDMEKQDRHWQYEILHTKTVDLNWFRENKILLADILLENRTVESVLEEYVPSRFLAPLVGNKIIQMRDLLALTSKELSELEGVGYKGLNAIEQALQKLKLTIRKNRSE